MVELSDKSSSALVSALCKCGYLCMLGSIRVFSLFYIISMTVAACEVVGWVMDWSGVHDFPGSVWVFCYYFCLKQVLSNCNRCLRLICVSCGDSETYSQRKRHDIIWTWLREVSRALETQTELESCVIFERPLDSIQWRCQGCCLCEIVNDLSQ